MAPPTATMTETATNGNSQNDGHNDGHTNGDSHKVPRTQAPLEPGLPKDKAKVQMQNFPGPPTFTDKYEERHYLKGRLAAAFRNLWQIWI